MFVCFNAREILSPKYLYMSFKKLEGVGGGRAEGAVIGNRGMMSSSSSQSSPSGMLVGSRARHKSHWLEKELNILVCLL